MPVPQKLKGRYEIREVLGQGGMGVVYRAYDDVVRRDVALKTLRDVPTRPALEMFFKECNVLAGLSHPNIIEIFDLGEYDEDGKSKPFFVMPLLPGATLDRLIKAASHRLTVERVVDMVCQVCRGLHAAHERGLVHRDIKPSNIYVLEDDSVKIIDFGVAHLVEQGHSVGVKGTLLYMAPEQLQMKPATPSSDIFSLGVVAYESLTRRRPFQGAGESDIAEAILRVIPPAASEINPSVSQLISRAIHKAMAKQPWNRYANAREFADTLAKALRNEPIEFFNPARIQPRIERASKAFDSGDLQFASEILNELESEGHIDPVMTTLRRQIELAGRTRAITQLLESARKRFEHEEYPLALQKVQEILQLDPGNAPALGLKASIENKLTAQKLQEWYRLAQQHLDNKAFGHAREALENVMQLRRGDSRATHMLSEIDRCEQEFIGARKQKQELYQSALEAWNAGEVSVALTKLERVIELDKQSPDTSAPGQTDSYQQFYNKVRSEHESMKNSYAEARKLMSDRNFTQAAAIANEWLAKHPGHALFQALKFDIDEQQRQELSARIASIDGEVDSEPDLDRKVSILEQAIADFPGEPHFERQLKPVRDKRDLVGSIAAKARWHEERGQFADALAQWEILKTIYSQYPGLSFEMERVIKRRDQAAFTEAKTRWLEQIERAMNAGEYGRAGELVGSAELEFPGDPELAAMKDQARDASAKTAEAEKLLEQARTFPGESTAEGLDTMRKALALAPRSQAVRTALVEALIENARALLETDWRAAEPFILEALEIEPNNALAKSLRTSVADHKRDETVVRCFTAARQHRAAGNLAAALREAEACFEQYPLDPRLQQLRDILKAEIDKEEREKQAVRDEEQTLQVPPAGAGAEGVTRAPAGALSQSEAEFQAFFGGAERTIPETQAGPQPGAPPPASAPPPPAQQPPAAPPGPAAAPPSTPSAPATPAPTAAPPKAPPAAAKPGPAAAKPAGPPRHKTMWIAAGAAAGILLAVGIIAALRMTSKPAVAGAVPVSVKTTPPGATIRVGGRVRGRSDFVLEIAPGEYQLEAALEGYLPASAKVKVAPGSAPVEFTLQPLAQTVHIYTDFPDGRVMIDAQPARNLEEGQLILDAVPAGVHSIRIASRVGQADFTIEIAPGRAPVVTGPPVVKDVAAMIVSNLGGTARVYSSLAPASVDVDGQAAGDAGPEGLQLLNLAPGTHEIAAGDGKTTLRKIVEVSAAPALTAFLQSDQNIGTLLVLAGEDGVDVFIDGRRYRQQTTRGGQIRIPRAPKEYRIRVAKAGFREVPEQTIQLAKGEEKKVVFRLEPLPSTSRLALAGSTAGVQVLLDGNVIGTVQSDGSFQANSIPPGEHSVELRSGRLHSRPVRKSFGAGQTVELASAEVLLRSPTGTLRLNITPAGAQVSVVRSGGGAVPVSGGTLELDEGSYVVTARASGYAERSETVQVPGGQTVQATLALVREPQRPKTVVGGMDGWQTTWSKDGEWYARKGGGMALYKPAASAGTYAFNILHAAGGGLFRGRDLEWVVDYRDQRNYVMFRLERDGFRRIMVVNGRRTETSKKPHGLDLKDQMLATVQVEVTPDVIVNRLKKGDTWITIDTYSRSADVSAGRFGINVQGSDMVRLSGFGFYPKE